MQVYATAIASAKDIAPVGSNDQGVPQQHTTAASKPAYAPLDSEQVKCAAHKGRLGVGSS